MVDKIKETRTAATDLLEAAVRKMGKSLVLGEISKRRPTDASHLRSIVDTLTESEDMMMMINHSSSSTTTTTTANSAKANAAMATPSGLTKPTESREGLAKADNLASLSQRRNVVVLGKPKLGADGKPVPKYNVKSSIPKPQPIPRSTKPPRFRTPGTTQGNSAQSNGVGLPSNSTLSEERGNGESFDHRQQQQQQQQHEYPFHHRENSFVSFSEVEREFTREEEREEMIDYLQNDLQDNTTMPISPPYHPPSSRLPIGLEDSMQDDLESLEEVGPLPQFAYRGGDFMEGREMVGAEYDVGHSRRVSVGIPVQPSDLLLSQQETRPLLHPPTVGM